MVSGGDRGRRREGSEAGAPQVGDGGPEGAGSGFAEKNQTFFSVVRFVFWHWFDLKAT